MTKQANSRLNIYGTKSIDVNDTNNIEIEHDGSKFKEDSSLIKRWDRIFKSLKSKNQKDNKIYQNKWVINWEKDHFGWK